ncbi:S8/S53 family peptidase [Deinococcus sp. QL22]|uniref:S8/S53 family peptidase n=1 Tax=Deinococcus sp. QL22 TaxID=2939437 RepID=UPI0020173064|nr:S8/S53 family peptidase [Deinococcus sp. QL22]UQN06925.1 S8/S53 family peptidase [Deinococcus sp. QL22]
MNHPLHRDLYSSTAQTRPASFSPLSLCLPKALMLTLALLTLLTVSVVNAQSTVATIPSIGTVFPGTAAPGERVWIPGPTRLTVRDTLWIGGQPATLVRDPVSGWLAFDVPVNAAGGPQGLGVNDPARQGGAVQGGAVLNVLPPESALGDVAIYVNPAAAAEIRTSFSERVKRFGVACQRGCPAELTATLNRLSALTLPALQPLSQPGIGTVRLPPVALNPVRVNPGAATSTGMPTLNIQNLRLPNLTLPNLSLPPLNSAAVVAARRSSFCSWVGTTLPTSGLPTGRVIALLGALFGDDLQVDPATGSHPTQADAPYQNEKPGTVLEKLIGAGTGSGSTGKGVTIHVLDTASGAGNRVSDPFIMGEPVNYYNQIYTGLAGHGSIVGQIAATVAPGAALRYQAVCDGAGNCSSLRVVQALCAVASEARQGGRHVVNFSLGGPVPLVGVRLALQEVALLGVPTAASYGNTDDCAGLIPGDRCWHYPADWHAEFSVMGLPSLIAQKRPTMLLSVAGWDIGTQEMATYNRAMRLKGVTAPPPSVQALGEFWFGGRPYFGTSFAAPVVAGGLALWAQCKPGVPFLPLVLTPGVAPMNLAALGTCP